MRNLLFVCLFVMMSSFASRSQTLVRKAYHGAQLIPNADGKGLTVKGIQPLGTLAAAGLKDEDILLTVNGKALQKLEDLTSLILQEGQKIIYTYTRDNKVGTTTIQAKGRPKEVFTKGENTYVVVPFGKNQLRGIVNKPTGAGPFPTVLFIQGYTCSAVCDAPDWHPYRRIAEGLAAMGYAVLRVEKPGMGESVGPTKCEEMDLLTERDAFEAGLNWLEAQPFALKGKSFIYGHSLGGIIAPMISDHRPLAGVAAYGTTHVPWLEYFYQMLRTQGPSGGQDYLENELAMRKYHKLLNLLLEDKKTPQEAIAIDTSFKRILINDFQYDGGRRLLGRDISTYWDLNHVNLTQAWAKTECPVLIGYGTADIEVMTPDMPKTIISIVNRYHPGNGTFMELQGLNHGYCNVGSQGVEYKNQDYDAKINLYKTAFDNKAVTMFTDWAAGK
jgi:dienelactone hydrolase